MGELISDISRMEKKVLRAPQRRRKREGGNIRDARMKKRRREGASEREEKGVAAATVVEEDGAVGLKVLVLPHSCLLRDADFFVVPALPFVSRARNETPCLRSRVTHNADRSTWPSGNSEWPNSRCSDISDSRRVILSLRLDCLDCVLSTLRFGIFGRDDYRG